MSAEPEQDKIEFIFGPYQILASKPAKNAYLKPKSIKGKKMDFT